MFFKLAFNEIRDNLEVWFFIDPDIDINNLFAWTTHLVMVTVESLPQDDHLDY